jgi:hypothetical protein
VTRTEAAKLVAVMCAAFPNAKVTDQTSLVYERMLGDLDYPAANAAVEQLLAVSKWMPTVAEIRERVLALHGDEVKPGGEAWGLVLEATSRYGRNRTPGVDFEFPDAVVGECVKAMSWRELCDSENQVADRARFVELYDQLAARRRRKQLSEGLPAMQRFRQLQASQAEGRLPPGEPCSEEPKRLGRTLEIAMLGAKA